MNSAIHSDHVQRFGPKAASVRNPNGRVFSTSRTRFQQLDPKNNQQESMCFRTFLGPNHRGQWHATFLFLPRRDGGSCGEGTTQRTGQGATWANFRLTRLNTAGWFSVRVVVSLFHSGILFCFSTCDVLVQRATQWSTSVHTSHIPKPVITFVFTVLPNGLLRYKLYACSL